MTRKDLGRVLGMGVASCMMLMRTGQASADVRNLGGTQNPTTGVWTGSASLVMAPVGNVGNVSDPATGYGQVDYAYSIGKYDVTAAQYTAFLNAVAATSDPQGLYNFNMGSGNNRCGIAQTYNADSHTYSCSRSHPRWQE